MAEAPELQTISTSATPNQESLTSIPCSICRRQFSRYACPKCNIPYCSLPCFRSESHSGCSETFCKKELESQIKTEPSKSMEERRKMMEMLKRFEEESAQDELALEDDSDDDFEERFNKLDLDNASYDDIWSALTPAEREKFMKAVGDPSSELAQTLLSSKELEKQITDPWWERPSDQSVETVATVSEGIQPRVPKKLQRYGRRPSLMEVPSTMVNPSALDSGNGPSLLYNICAVLVTYAYATRFLSTSPLSNLQDERREARQIFSQLVPFLVDKKSKTILPSVKGLVTDIWSRFSPDTMTAQMFSILLRDASKLLRPSLVTPMLSKRAPPTPSQGSNESHPHIDAVLSLSDISALFQPHSTSETSGTTSANQYHHVSHKLTFYAARILSTSSPILQVLSAELGGRADLISHESNSSPESKDTLTGRSETHHHPQVSEVGDPERRGTSTSLTNSEVRIGANAQPQAGVLRHQPLNTSGALVEELS